MPDIHAGDTLILRMTILAGEMPLDLTGAYIEWILAVSPHDRRTPLATKNNEPSGGIEMSGLGQFDVAVSSADTRHSGTFYHEVMIIEEDGHVSHPINGAFTILPSRLQPQEIAP